MPIDYSKSKIYKLIDNTNNNVYIGSTCQSLAQRLVGHIRSYKGYTVGSQNYMTSFEIIKNGNYDMVLLEECSCENKEQLHAIERKHIDDNNCINKFKPNKNDTDFKQWQEDYYVQNKVKLNDYSKKYNDINKDKINEYRNQAVTCECGCIVKKSTISQHRKSKKHLGKINK